MVAPSTTVPFMQESLSRKDLGSYYTPPHVVRTLAAAVGNPPFIRYQRFTGRARQRALEYCASQGVKLSGLCSSWAPFVVGASRLLEPGGRLAFVVPAEIGHAVYARDVVRYLLRSFERVEVIAVREKLFPDLSEDCWLLRASGFGGHANVIHFARLDSLGAGQGPWSFLDDVDEDVVGSWIAADRPVLLLDLAGVTELPQSVTAYLGSAAGQAAIRTYKCRNRKPWFAVPDVRTPHAFLTIMSGQGPRLVRNSAGVTCTNSVHAVHFLDEADAMRYVSNWRNELTTLSCELEGHALGGGVLKIEPAEARRVLLAPELDLSEEQKELLRSGTRELRRWRHIRAA